MVEHMSVEHDGWLEEEWGPLASCELAALEAIPLDPSDRPWMEQLGCEWPNPKDEQTWLGVLNRLVEKANCAYAQEEDAHAVLQARRQFFDLFLNMEPEVSEAAYDQQLRGVVGDEASLPIRPCLVIGVQRFVQSKNLDVFAARLAAKTLLFQRILDEDRVEREYPLLWDGPLLVEASEYWLLDTYEKAVAGSLNDWRFAALSSSIQKGRMAESELREIDSQVVEDVEQLDGMVKQRVARAEQSQLAKRALIVSYLGMVAEVARGCQRRGEWAEVVAIGNLALTRFVCEEYEPASREVRWAEERRRFERQALAVIMRNLVGYAPRYKGRTIDGLEALWATEDGENT